MIIYKIQNKVNGKIYIGQTIRTLKERLSSHFFDECTMKYAFKKYKKEMFEISIIDKANDFKELNEKEKYWIRFYNSQAPNGYNLTKGGGSSKKRILRKEKERSKIFYSSLENEERVKFRFSNLNGGMLGKHHTEKSRDKISKAMKGKPKPEEFRIHLCGNKNPAKREDIKKKISEKKRGKETWIKGVKKINEQWVIPISLNNLSKITQDLERRK